MKEEMTATIQMHDEQGSLQTLQRHEPTHPEKTLGMLTPPNSSMESFELDDAGEQIRVGQIPYLQEKVKEFTTKIKSAQNTLPNDVWVAITSTIMKTLEYPMTASTITKQGWDEIMKPLLRYLQQPSLCSSRYRVGDILLVCFNWIISSKLLSIRQWYSYRRFNRFRLLRSTGTSTDIQSSNGCCGSLYLVSDLAVPLVEAVLWGVSKNRYSPLTRLIFVIPG